MTKVSSRRRWLWASLTGTLCLSSCLSPTLPLPPPGEPTVEGPSASGQYTLSGNVVEPNAHVQAANLRLGLTWGQFSDASGAYRFNIEAEPGDELQLWYELGSERSSTIIFDIPE